VLGRNGSNGSLRSMLVVEEHEEVRAALREWLLGTYPDLKLREARNLTEAIDCAQQASPDMVLVNMELPGPNGIEATRQLRRRELRCPVVVMSLHDSAALRVAAEQAGADAFVPKRDMPQALTPFLSRFSNAFSK
jgi:DNA-binding NarL/FixJ family response regulator